MVRGFLQRMPSGASVEIAHPLTRIGRGKQCEFQIDSDKLGREHSLVIRRSSGFWLADLQSSYGTWLARGGGKPARIGSAVVPLADGDVIGLHAAARFALGAPAHIADSPAPLNVLSWPGGALSSPDLRLTLEWTDGQVRRAKLEELRHAGTDLLQCVRALVWSPATELMTDLELILLPAPQRSREGTLAHRLVEGVRELLVRSHLPALRRLRLSPPLDTPALRLPGSPLLE